MKSILTLIITLILISTFGCNYEYGNYGKSKSDEKNTEAPEPTNQAIQLTGTKKTTTRNAQRVSSEETAGKRATRPRR